VAGVDVDELQVLDPGQLGDAPAAIHSRACAGVDSGHTTSVGSEKRGSSARCTTPLLTPCGTGTAVASKRRRASAASQDGGDLVVERRGPRPVALSGQPDRHRAVAPLLEQRDDVVPGGGIEPQTGDQQDVHGRGR
jgi:hypothetical protein